MFSRLHQNDRTFLVLPLVAAGLVGYLLGSLPAAYLMVRWKSNIDIRSAGSGNVGTLNSFQVTRSKLVGVAVLLVDLFKGVAAVLAGRALAAADPFTGAAVAGFASVVGHNFPVWLGFRGGRGLATAAGVLFPLQWLLPVAWGIGWAAAFLPVRRVNVANAAATVFVILSVLLLPGDVLRNYLPAGATIGWFRVFCVAVLAVILARHVKPVREYLEERRAAKRNDGQTGEDRQ